MQQRLDKWKVKVLVRTAGPIRSIFLWLMIRSTSVGSGDLYIYIYIYLLHFIT